MPIRRAAGPPSQEMVPKNTPAGKQAAKDVDASSEESVSTGEEQETEVLEATKLQEELKNGNEETQKSEEEKKDEEKSAEGLKKEDKDTGKEKEKKITVKKTIPSWATMSAKQLARSQKRANVALYSRPKLDAILTEAIQACSNRSGASAFAIRKYMVNKYPSLDLDKRSYLLKQALKRVLQRGAVKQVKGKGFSGSFIVAPSKKSKKKSNSGSNKAPLPLEHSEKLEDTLPLVFTRLCEPKEASYRLIKRYVEQYFPKLKVNSRPHMLKNALQRAVEKKQLEQITGKGASGTFQLKKVGDKPLLSGGPFEDAIVSAITAMNEPKTCSTKALKRFILGNNQGGRVYLQVNNLKRTLRRCEMFGWMEKITGKGFSGTYQLCFPYYPSPATLFPDKHKDQDSEDEASSEEEDSEDESEEESEEESPPSKRQKKRPPPKVRAPLPPKRRTPAGKKRTSSAQKVSTPAFSSKSKRATSVKKPAASRKKAVTPGKVASNKQVETAKKASTPSTKKMTSRLPKKPSQKTPVKSSAKSPVKEKSVGRKSLRMKK
ncbi:heterochromatin protein 1-binding protein 3 [Erpetoichthys calabaricus]|nr:heterochromatin protein 1-binding protein 3 [Erpetoichthys calabaricus]